MCMCVCVCVCVCVGEPWLTWYNDCKPTLERKQQSRDQEAIMNKSYEASESEVAQSCLTLCDHMDCSHPPDSSVHGIFQARILEWVAISFSTYEANHPLIICF